MLPHDFPVEQEHSVSPRKVLSDLFLAKTFHGRRGTILWGKFKGG